MVEHEASLPSATVLVHEEMGDEEDEVEGEEAFLIERQANSDRLHLHQHL